MTPAPPLGDEGHERLGSRYEAALEALHSVELGIEHPHRVYGYLVAFHHSTGRVTNHLADAEDRLGAADQGDLADEIRDEYLPRGVIEGRHPDDRGRWSYDVLETDEEVLLKEIVAVGTKGCDAVAGGLRHAHERRQESDWERRSRRD